jgi:hypothetical protein
VQVYHHRFVQQVQEYQQNNVNGWLMLLNDLKNNVNVSSSEKKDEVTNLVFYYFDLAESNALEELIT